MKTFWKVARGSGFCGIINIQFEYVMPEDAHTSFKWRCREDSGINGSVVQRSLRYRIN